MNEPEVLERLHNLLPHAGDDAAVVDGLVLTTDMLHETTDFPEGITPYTAGWRAVGASLSDIAAMGAEAVATVAVYAAPVFDWEAIEAFVEGARAVSASVDSSYVGGDLDTHDEFTVGTTALGRTDKPVGRNGAQPGDVVCVTGELGRSAVGFELFQQGEYDRANELFQFPPRVRAGRVLAEDATAMMDSSDGLARSVHQLARASDCGFDLESPLPVHEEIEQIASREDRHELSIFFGEDFELVCTLPPEQVDPIREKLDVSLTKIGRVMDTGVFLDGEKLPNRGYAHG